MEIIVSYFIRVGLLVFIFCFFYLGGKFLSALNKKRAELLDYRPVPENVVLETTKKYGRNTNSIIHLYGKLFHFRPRFKSDSNSIPLVGYVPLTYQNVMITDPLCSGADTKEVILEFARYTQRANKDCLLFPINEATARQAAELGFGLIQIGKEPVFDLAQYSPEKHAPKILSAIQQVRKKGIQIRPFSAFDLEQPEWKDELHSVLNEWFLSRKSEKMELISEVSPFKQADEKRFFVAHNGHKIEAFLACSPIFGKNGFFIHDLIRRPAAVNGVSEALIITALKTLKEEGCAMASLGIASLAGLDEPGVNSNYPFLNKLLVRVFNKHDSFIKFKGLYHFKKKFGPTREEPAYLAFYPPKFKIGYAVAIGGMFSGRGFFGDLLFKWKRWMDGTQFPRLMINFLSPEVVTLSRPSPFTLGEFLGRLKFTCAIFFLNVYTYLNSTSYMGKITPEMLEKYSFNYVNFYDHKWFILITSNFLHFNYLHLFSNMALLFLFCGTLELLGGTALAALAFLISMNANVPMGMILLPLLKSVDVPVWKATSLYTDVGASLGVMGALGALFQFLKYKGRLLSVVLGITIVVAFYQRNYFGIDHAFALVIGYIVGYFFFNRGYPKAAFRKLAVFFDRPSSHNSPIPFRNQPRR